MSDMDEYIKRSEVVGLIEDKLKRCEIVHEALAFASLRTAVMGLRSASVAPRAEVNEAYWEGVEYGNKDGAALVAREIFEEIEKIIKGPFAVGFCMTASSFRQAISDYNEGIRKEILYYIAELKKKYTEAEPPKGD